MSANQTDALRVTFLYWGRRGAMPRFGLELLRASAERNDIDASASLSLQNELLQEYRTLGVPLHIVDTFKRGIGAITEAWRLPGLRKSLVRGLRAAQCDVVVNLMPHVWTPYLVPAIQAAGMRHVTIVHDAYRHPGDPTGLMHDWCMREVARSDLVVTLSESVSQQLEKTGLLGSGTNLCLFHPDLAFRRRSGDRQPYSGARPLRLLFFGRILPYKGLGLLLDALDIVRARGTAVHLGIFGEGNLGVHAQRLSRMGAEVVNRWLSDEEVASILPNWDAMALSHVEASQSGVAAVAFAATLPVVATPVGGLREQVIDGVNGVMAETASPEHLADAIDRLAGNPDLHQILCRGIERTKNDRSMQHFLDLLAARLISDHSGD